MAAATSITNGFSSIFIFWNLLVVLATLLYIYWWRRPHLRYPPGPRGLPVLGVLPFVGRNPAQTFKKWSLEKYGPVMSVRLGREDAVVLNTLESVNQALVKQSATFSDRPYTALFSSITGQNGIGFKNYNDDYKALKHFGLKFLREKGITRQNMARLLNEEGDIFIEFIKNHSNKPIDLKMNFYWLTSNVVSRFMLGKRQDYDAPAFRKLVEALSLIFSDPETALRVNLINQYAFLAKVPWFKQAMDKYEDRMHTIIDYCNDSIQEHKKRFDPSNVDDFIDSFLCEAQFGKENSKQAFSDEQLSAYCRDLFLAGSETSSTSLAWCFVYYLNYPEYRKMIDSEVQKQIGGVQNIMISEKHNMPFTCAFLQEVARCRTTAPLALFHATSETSKLMGHVIPKGTTVLPNLLGVHMDPETWPNPEEFNPHRHIDSSGKFVHSNKVIQFSVGARFCLGESLARAEVFLIFVKIIQHFKIRPAKGVPPMNNPIVAGTLMPQECEVRAEPRE